MVGLVTCDQDPHAFLKKEFDPVALSAPRANAWQRSRQLYKQIDGLLIPCADYNAPDVIVKRGMAVTACR